MDQNSESAEGRSFAEAMEASMNFKTPAEGDLLRGTIVSISGDDVFVGYGGPSEAVISLQEVAENKVGDVIEATVVRTSPDIRISKKLMAGRASAQALRGAYENRMPVEGKITGRNKGGFDVTVGGVRAFCPLSQIGLGKIENADAFVNQTYEFILTELSEDGRKVVVSRAALLKEQAAVKGAELRKTMAVGSVLPGIVKNIMPFGAFIDLGGVEGLLHVSEISRRRISDPKEVLSVGQQVQVKIIKMDAEGKRISLSTKEFEADPWSDVAERFQPGMQFSGKVARATDFGLFVEVEQGLDGLVHVSQLPIGLKLSDPSLAVGSTVTGWVREVDSQKRRLSLALREVSTIDPWETAPTRFAAGKVIEGVVERAGGPGVFIQLEPGLTGLIPISELGLPSGSDPAKTFKPGDKLVAKVISIDPQRKRISLSVEGAKAAAERGEYLEYVADSKQETVDGKSAMALALEKAMKK